MTKTLFPNDQTRLTVVYSITQADGKKIAWIDHGYVIEWNGSEISAATELKGRNQPRDHFASFNYVVQGTTGIAATASINSCDYTDDARFAELVQDMIG
ncbi:MAG TPA: hypothetical protein VFA60_01165 [Terriglobales bacterium]|nr:hypothetical protein [Terriglobales bacterium]